MNDGDGFLHGHVLGEYRQNRAYMVFRGAVGGDAVAKPEELGACQSSSSE